MNRPALINIGSNPLVRNRAGEQALLSFLYGYVKYPNKAYFRQTVQMLLDLGMDPYDCFRDQSACLLGEMT